MTRVFPSIAASAPVRLPALLACLLLGLLPLAAEARVGDGIKMGPGRLKLGVGLEGRYDSRVGAGIYGNTQDPGDGIGVGRASIDLNVPAQSARLTLKGNVDWNQYAGFSTSATQGLSFFGAKLDGSLAINPTGRVGLELSTRLNRSDRVSNPVFGLGVLGLQNTNKARLRLRPGGGAFEFGASYEFAADIFSRQASPDDSGASSGLCQSDPSCNPDLAAAFNTVGHRVGVDFKWRFLPKTGLSLEADYGFRDYLWGSEFIPNQSARPIRALLGFGTLLSTKVSFSLRGGYQGMTFADSNEPMLHNWLGQAELGVRLTETFQVRAGYARSFEPVGFTYLYFADNRVYAELKTQLQRLVLTLGGSADLIDYGGGSPRSDLAFGLNARAEYHATRWLSVVGGLGFNGRDVSGMSESDLSAYDYSRWELTLGVATSF